MKAYPKKIIRIMIGLFLYALGLVMNMKANLGYAPWEIFHYGLSLHIGITIGMVSICTSLIICLFSILAGEKLGLGTVLNMLVIGTFMDVLLFLDIIPAGHNLISGLLMMAAGFFIIAFATYFYMSAGMGAGPRDGLMVILRRKTGFSSGVCRAAVEIIVALLGWAMGGPLGIGTVLAMFGNGICTQLIFTLLKFDPATIPNESFDQTAKAFRKALASHEKI